jgi:uncharacterized membrane protein YccC
MFTKMMKWLSIVVLLPAVFWQPSAGYQLGLQFVVCAGATLVALQAVRSEKYIWAIGFVGIAMLFNPFQPLVFSRAVFLSLGWVSVATFLVSLATLKAKPGLALPSITGQLR